MSTSVFSLTLFLFSTFFIYLQSLKERKHKDFFFGCFLCDSVYFGLKETPYINGFLLSKRSKFSRQVSKYRFVEGRERRVQEIFLTESNSGKDSKKDLYALNNVTWSSEKI